MGSLRDHRPPPASDPAVASHSAVLSCHLEAVRGACQPAICGKTSGDLSGILRATLIAVAALGVGRGAGVWFCVAALGVRFRTAPPGRRHRVYNRPLYERHHLFHLGAGRRGPAHPVCEGAYGPRSWPWLWVPGDGNWLSSSAVPVIFPSRSEHLVAGRARRLASHRGGTVTAPRP